jgi:hypothetical protein|tara:strand:- start:15250 stop:15582 length:333 start_codon:yes stop_codon:yes gene_type:complete
MSYQKTEPSRREFFKHIRNAAAMVGVITIPGLEKTAYAGETDKKPKLRWRLKVNKCISDNTGPAIKKGLDNGTIQNREDLENVLYRVIEECERKYPDPNSIMLLEKSKKA